MRILSILFWSGISVAVGLVVLVFMLRVIRRYGGPLSGVANTVAGAAGVAA